MISDDYFIDIHNDDFDRGRKYFVLVIYDIVDNKRRSKIAKTLKRYAFRVQKSAFEAHLTPSKYDILVSILTNLIDDKEDSVRIYKIRGKAAILSMGIGRSPDDEEVIII